MYIGMGYYMHVQCAYLCTHSRLSGLSPFLGDNDGETCANVTRGEYFYPDDDFPPVSEDAKRFIDDCLLSAPKYA